MRTRVRLLAAVLCAPLLTAPGAAADADGEGPVVEVVAVTGSLTRARWRGLASGLEVQPEGGGEARTLPLLEVREARLAAPETLPGDVVRVTLVAGEVLHAQRLAPTPDGIEVTGRAFGTLRVAFEALRTLEPIPASDGACHEPAGRFPAQPGNDRVALLGGDELSGTILAAEVEGLRVEIARGRERLVPWTQLLVAQFDNPCPARPDALVTEVETVLGDVLVATEAVRGDASLLHVPLASDGTLGAQVPLALVRAIRWRGGPHPCVDAASLAFRAETKPLLAAPEGSLTALFKARDQGVRVGRRPRGCPLRLDGVRYVHGFAVHSGSTITLPLGGQYASFDALVGIDDEAEEAGRGRVPVPGDVDVRVLGDGKVLWEAKGVAGLESARKVGPIDVRGVQALVLAVDYGGNDDLLDRATWGDPVLTRKAP